MNKRFTTISSSNGGITVIRKLKSKRTTNSYFVPKMEIPERPIRHQKKPVNIHPPWLGADKSIKGNVKIISSPTVTAMIVTQI